MGKIDLLNLEEEELVSDLAGQKILIYGSNSVGKTFQACKMDRPLLLMTESGGGALKVRKIAITKWAQFKEVVEQLTNDKTYEEMYKKYRTIIIDTLDNLSDLSELAICREFGARDLSEIVGKQNGYNIARKDFAQQINKLTAFGYTVVFIAHEDKEEKTDEATGETYEQIIPKGTKNSKSSARMVRDLCDFKFYVYSNGIDRETGDTILSSALCKETKTTFAGSRYAVQAFINPFTAETLKEAILKAIEKSASIEGAGLKEFKKDLTGYSKNDMIELIKPYFKCLYKLYPDETMNIVEGRLGEGAKISDATDEQLNELEVIYNQLVTLSNDKGIVVEIE